MFEITVERSFSAAHNLKKYKGKCENLHGHNYAVRVIVRGKNLADNGLLIDFKVLKDKLNEILKPLDHAYLNDLSFFKENNPSAENISLYIYNECKRMMPVEVALKRVCVSESPGNWATYYEE